MRHNQSPDKKVSFFFKPIHRGSIVMATYPQRKALVGREFFSKSVCTHISTFVLYNPSLLLYKPLLPILFQNPANLLHLGGKNGRKIWKRPELLSDFIYTPSSAISIVLLN